MCEHTIASRSRCLLLWLLLGAALWSATACAKRQASTAPAPPEVQASAARNTVIVPTELLAGTIAPFQNVAIQTSLTEPTTAVNVNEGDIVHRGEVLALLDTRDLQADYQSFIQTAKSNEAKLAQYSFQAPLTLTQGSSGVQSAQAMLAQAQKTLATDQVNLTRDQMLTTNGYIAQQIVDQQIALVANDQQSVRNLQASLTTAQALLTANGTINRGLPASIIQQGKADIATSLAQAAQIEAQIVRATIYSPTDGVVVNRNLNPGEYPGTRQIFTIQQLDPVYAVLSASGTQIGSIRRGAAVTITSANQPALHSYPGTVVAILGQVNPGSTNFIVKARLENPEWRVSPVLTSGTVVSATITLRPIRGVGVPATALLTDAHNSVMVVTNGTTRTVAVHELGSNGTTSIVTGLSPGALVVNDGQLGLSDGQQVAVMQ